MRKSSSSLFGRLGRKRAFWISLYVLYLVFIILSVTAFYAEHTIKTRASGTYEYSLKFTQDGLQDHYKVTRTIGGSEIGRIFVTFDADQHKLDVKTKNIRQLTIDCRSIAEEKTEEILWVDYEENTNYYKTYFTEYGKEFTVNVDVDHDIDLTLEDIPYPQKVTLDGDILIEGAFGDYYYENGMIKNVQVPEGKSEVKIYFEGRGELLTAHFTTNNEFFYHAPNTNIEFDASASIGNIVDYIWDFGDGSFVQGMNSWYSYSEEGDYEVILLVRDGNGLIQRCSNVLRIYDMDEDSLPDDWEKHYFGDLMSQKRNDDYDGDGLNNWKEYEYNTDPKNKDTDNDGFTDKEEVDAGTDPLDPSDKPEKKTGDGDGLLGMGKIGGLDVFIMIILIIIIIIMVFIAGIFMGRKGMVEEEEEEIEEKAEEEEIEEEEAFSCPECGASVSEDQQECGECGAILEWEVEEEPGEIPTPIPRETKEEPVTDQPALGIQKVPVVEPEIPKDMISDADIAADIIEEFECPTCGATVDEEDTVCPTCGEEFE